MLFGQARMNGRVVRIPAWAMVLGALAAISLLAVVAVLAAGVALVAIPLALAGGFIARKVSGTRRTPGFDEAGRFGSNRQSGPVVIDTTWEDVTDRPRKPGA